MAPKKQQKKGHAEAPVETIFQLLVSLGEPPDRVWRRVLVSSRTRFSELHTLLQLVMGWGDEHEHQFLVHEKHYGPDEQDAEPRIYDERKPSLASRLEVGDEFHYLYDFGDSWEHLIKVEAELPLAAGQVYPVCIAGCLACPPEDCGGIYGYMDIADGLLAPERDPELEDAYGDFDPYDFSVSKTNEELHGQPVSAPRDGAIDPALSELAEVAAAAVKTWWLASERDAVAARVESDATLASALCRTVVAHPSSAAQLKAIDEACADRLRLWLAHVPIDLAEVGQLERGLALVDELGPLALPDHPRAIRAALYATAGQTASAKTELDALLVECARDPKSLLTAALLLVDLKEWSPAEALLNEHLEGELSSDERAFASAVLVDLLRETGRVEEAEELEAEMAELAELEGLDDEVAEEDEEEELEDDRE
jgi:hypothetical protein